MRKGRRGEMEMGDEEVGGEERCRESGLEGTCLIDVGRGRRTRRRRIDMLRFNRRMGAFVVPYKHSISISIPHLGIRGK